MNAIHAPHIDYAGLSPLLALAGGICVTLLLGLARGPGTRTMVTTAALLTLGAATTLTAWQFGENKTLVEGALRADDLAFSLYPVPGALDVLVAPEFMEVGRMIELGFVSPARTTVIASTHRLLSIHEKIATGRAIYPQDGLRRAAETAAHRLVAFDALALAREHGTEASEQRVGGPDRQEQSDRASRQREEQPFGDQLTSEASSTAPK